MAGISVAENLRRRAYFPSRRRIGGWTISPPPHVVGYEAKSSPELQLVRRSKEDRRSNLEATVFRAEARNYFSRSTRRGAGAALAIALSLLHLGNAQAAPIVDWLAYSAGTDRTHFSLKDDGGLTVAQAEIQLTAGTLAPLSPSAGLLQAPFWVTTPDFTDSLLANATVATSKVQVAPQAGSVQYKLAMTGSDFSGLYFAVGQLFSTGTSGTLQINVAAKTGVGTGVAIDFLGTNAWDDGIRLYDQALNWDGGLGKLSFGAGASGESQFAFFQIAAGSSPVTSLTFDIPSGYNSGLGDALEFALARQVPEPGSAALWLSGFGIFLVHRTRRRPAWR